MDMRVKMILDLVANTKGGAKQARADLKGVKDAAKGLDGAKGGQRLNRDFLNLSSSSKQAVRYLRDTKTAANQLGASTGPKRLNRDVLALASSAKAAGREIDQVGRKAARAQAEAARARKPGPAGGRESAKDGGTTLFGGTKALVGGYLGVQGARMAVGATIGKSISFEKAMAEVKKKVDGMDDPAELAKMEKLITGSAVTYGRSREEVAGLVAEAGAGGIGKNDMAEFVRINLAAATAWDATADKTSNALAKIRASTQWLNPQLEEFVDKVNALADSGAAKEMDVVEMFQRAGAAAKKAGVDFDTSLAFLTGMNNVAIAPEVASRAFTAFSGLLRTAKSRPKRVNEGLKMLGLTPDGVEKGMRADARGTMLDVLQRVEKHTDAATVAIKIFGEQWWDEIARAGQALPEIIKNLQIVGDPKKWKGSAQQNLNIQLATTSNHLERLKALASEVGDRLGRWTLPYINERIEQIIAGMDALDRRAAERAQERADRAAEDATAGRVAGGEALSAEERDRMARDAAYRQRIQEGAAGKRTDKVNLGLTNNLRLSELERERADLGSSIEARRKAGATDEQLAYSVNRLAAIVAEIRTIDPSRVPAALDPRRPADQDDRAHPGRGEALALLERVKNLEARLAATEQLGASSTNAADRAGFGADAARIRTRLGSARRPGGSFGFGVGGIPASATPKGAGPGLGSFGLSIKDWAKSLIGEGDIDLGGAGMTIAESLATGLRQGGASAEAAAQGIRDGITGAFGGADLSSAGAAMMATLANGIRSGGPGVVAAVNGVAAQARAAAGGSSRRISGALHDGVE